MIIQMPASRARQVLTHREDALEAITEAVIIGRRHAEQRPDAFLPDLAGSLNNLSVLLAALGRTEGR
jgi:hypothetical protein